MDHRKLLAAAVLTAGIAASAGLAGSAKADIIATDNGIAVKESGVAAPTRGMTMGQVANRFGAPAAKIPPVGKPPISRWKYPGFEVYFERELVIHSVVANS
jgi:hypothetical protein